MEGVRQVDTGGNGTNAAVPNAVAPGSEGAGLDKSLSNYAAWFKAEWLPNSKWAMFLPSISAGRIWLTKTTRFCTTGCASYEIPEWNDTMNVECYNTYNETSPFYTNKDPGAAINEVLGVQWLWMQCNQPMMWYQT